MKDIRDVHYCCHSSLIGMKLLKHLVIQVNDFKTILKQVSSNSFLMESKSGMTSF